MGSRTANQTLSTGYSTSSVWIRNPIYDLGLVTGGAFFTLAIAAMAFSNPLLLPLFFWIWIVGFEGSHFWATFTRTYFDRKFREENKPVLLGSLVFFLFPALALWAQSSSNQSIEYATLYGFFIFCWSLYHNARQHYGFMSIYSGKIGVSSDLKSKLTRALYMVICFAQAHFLLNFKIQGVFGLSTAASVNPTLGFLVNELPMALTAFGILYFIKIGFETVDTHGRAALMPLVYIGTCAIFYSTMFYYIAPRDHFVQNLSGIETLMLIAIMNSLFHNIQYHAIVYHYGQKRYQTPQPNKAFGSARWINKNLASYIGFALTLGLVFAGIVWNLGDWPNVFGQWTQNSGMQPWAYVLFFGIIGHHFYLDQKIWRPSKNKELKSYL